jgi:hypothetical protein
MAFDQGSAGIGPGTVALMLLIQKPFACPRSGRGLPLRNLSGKEEASGGIAGIFWPVASQVQPKPCKLVILRQSKHG